MKAKISVAGSKVHDIGYRPFLIELANEFGIEKFEVHARVVEGKQVIIAKVDADEDQVQGLIEAMRSEADVSEISYELFEGRVRSIEATSWTCAYLQLAKCAGILEHMDDK